jgi:hypothetical protein
MMIHAASGEELDPYANVNNNKNGKAVIELNTRAIPNKPVGGVKKRAAIANDEYVAPLSKAAKKKQLKQKKKKALTVAGDMDVDEEFDDEPYDFDADFVAQKESTQAPEDEVGGEFEFQY